MRSADRLRNVDSLFAHYDGIRLNCLSHLGTGELHTGDLWESYLDSDNYCSTGCSSECGHGPLCIDCRSISRLCPDGAKSFTVETGRLKGTLLQLRRRERSNCGESGGEVRAVASRLLGRAVPPHYTTLDPVTSDILVSWALESAIEGTPRIYAAYQCRSTVTTLEESTTPLGEVTLSLTTDQWRGVTTSVIGILCSLAIYDFTLPMPSPRDLLLATSWISGSDPSGCRLRFDLGGSAAISTADVRLVGCCVLPGHLSTVSLGRLVETFHLSTTYDYGAFLYCINGTTSSTLTRLRSAGISLFSGSYELYFILVGLYCCSGGRGVVVSLLGHLWEQMWPGSGDLECIEKRTSLWMTTVGEGTLPSYYDLIEIIAGLWLRSDLVRLLSPISTL